MSKFLFVILFSFSTYFSNAQAFQNEYCGHRDMHLNLKRNKIKNSEPVISNTDLQSVMYRIPVKFWIYRRSNGKSGINEEHMKEFIRYLNYYYSTNNSGLRFYLRPDYEYIDKDRLFNLNYFSQAPFQTIKNRSKGCINVHVSHKLIMYRKKSIDKNYSGTYNSFSNGVLMAQGTPTSTLSHEIGHYLGLKHPHRLWKFKLLQEPVSRNKKTLLKRKKLCEKRGDKLCDTPAEPNLTKYTDTKCRYTGWNVTDKHGEVYKPATDNLMSYTNNRECRTQFTKGQIDVMHQILKRSKYYEFWKVDSTKTKNYEFDPFEPNGTIKTASEIFLNTPQVHTFHKIFAGKKNKDLNDNTDWLFFELKTKNPQNIIITSSETNYKKTDIKLSVYYKNDLILEKVIHNDNYHKEIELNNIKPGQYFIKLEQITTKEHITGVKIKVAN